MLAELADTFGVTKHSAWLYSHRDDFPKPLDVVSAGAIWKLTQVEAWGKRFLFIVEQKKVTDRRWQPGFAGSLPVGRPKGATAKGRRR